MGSKTELINNFVKVYRTLSEIPGITSARISKTSTSDLVQVSSIWSQRNIEQGELIKFEKNFLIKGSDVVFESTPSDISNEELTRASPSEKLRCVVRKTKQENKKKQFVEIWTQNGLNKNFDVSAFDVHGDIYTDGEFGTLEWSPSEDKILYIAEKKVNKSEPFYKQKTNEETPKDEKAPTITGDEYIFKPDWGEQLVGKHQPVIGICDVKKESLSVLEGVPANFSPGQLIWSKDGNNIYGIVLENEPRRLGLIYCTNRLSYIFQLSLKGDFRILSDRNNSVRSPRLSPDGKGLFWLQRPVTGAHNACQELVKLDLTSNKKEVYINIVRGVDKTFSGLFLHHLPRRCFSKDGTKLFFTSSNKLRDVSYSLNLATKEIQPLNTGDGSSTILDVQDDIVLVSTSTLQQTPSLKIAKSLAKPEWITVSKSKTISEKSVLKEMEFESKTGNQKFTYYNALYYGPPSPSDPSAKFPLIVYPHGGPHSAILNSYAFEANYLVTIGYGVLMVNYRGSTGVGQDGIELLQGNIGDTDVKDNHEAVLHTLKNIPYLDSKNVFLYGRSHGGYLVGQLSAQYPDFYRAVVSGNPVTDVPGMYLMSDIPDWATGECGIVFDESKPLNSQQLTKLITASPIQLSDKVKAPTLFLIGKKDLRVPYYGGVKMYYALKARKVKTRLNLYEDNHTLGNVPNHMDCLINTVLWFADNKS